MREMHIMVVKPTFTRLQFPVGRESTASLRDLAPDPPPPLDPLCIGMVVWILMFLSVTSRWNAEVPFGKRLRE